MSATAASLDPRFSLTWSKPSVRAQNITALMVIVALLSVAISGAVAARSGRDSVTTAQALTQVVPDVLKQSASSSGASLPQTLTALSLSGGVAVAVEGAPSSLGREVAPGVKEYGVTSTGVGVAAQELGNGAYRLLSVHANADAASSSAYRMTLPAGASLQEGPGGEVAVIGSDGVLVGMFAEPWARDAAGKSLPTNFEVNGNVVTQRVDTAGASFPVVSDPFWIPALVMRACGIGWLSGGASYYVGGGTSLWRFLASGAVGCVFGIIGRKF
jgi:hypothetical protein